MDKKKVLGFFGGIMLLFILNFVSAAFSLTSALQNLDQAGIFYYILPFLLVFALIFGILEKSGILGSNRGVIAIIAAAIGLMAALTPYFPDFLKIFAPKLAAGISILLAAIILMGLFYKNGESGISWIIYVLFGVGALAFIFVITGTFSGDTLLGGNVWEDYGPGIITLLILGFIIWVIVKQTGSGSSGSAAKPGHP